MIGKITKGSDFHGLIGYLMRDDRGEVIDLHNLSSGNPVEAAGEMALGAALSKRVRKPVFHCSLSYGPDEKPTEAQMRADAVDALKSLRLEHHQAIVVRHQDKAHTHMHIAINRVGADGRVTHDAHSYAKLETVLRKIEGDRGWAPVLGRHAPSSDGFRMSGHAKRMDSRQTHVPATVRDLLLEARTWRDLHAGLETEGWKIEIKRRSGQKAGALLRGPNGEKIAAGKIDRRATLAKLNGRLSPSSQIAPTAFKKKKINRGAKTANRAMQQLIGDLAHTLGDVAAPNRKKFVLTSLPRHRRRLTRNAPSSLNRLPRMR